MMEFYVQTNDIFKENFEKYMAKSWGAKGFKDIPEKYFTVTMDSILRNIEQQPMEMNNGNS